MTRRACLPRSAWLVLSVALFSAGCTGSPFGDPGPTPAAAPAAPPVPMAGRWHLASASGAACAMTFTASSPEEGTIAPAGGCPANLFTSRRWMFETGTLVIQDHNRKTLVVLNHNSGRFEGELPSSEAIWLQR